MRQTITAFTALLLALSCSDTGGQSGEPSDGGFRELRSALTRELDPDASEQDVAALADGNRAFALDMYSELVEGEGNLFFSPYSISLALTMTYAGAAGTTAEEMAQTLHFGLPDDALHAAFNRVDLALTSRGQDAEGQDGEPFRLRVTNAVWGQEGREFLDSFLDTLAVNYGAGLRLLDFAGAPEESREVINAWVEQETEERIAELLPAGSIDPTTIMVLVNAIYFNAAWETKFDPEATQDGAFTTLAGDSVQVPMMTESEQLAYYDAGTAELVEKRYDGGELSMVLIVPPEGTFESFEAELDAQSLGAMLEGLAPAFGVLSMPRFRHEGESISLKPALMALGMVEAFGAADFSKLVEGGGPFIEDVYHQAFIAVDEAGTEAAAATAVVIGERGAPMPEFTLRADRPFLYLIRDLETNTIVFMGRVTDPR